MAQQYDVDAAHVHKTYRSPWRITSLTNMQVSKPAKPALQDVNLTVSPGEALGVIGLNGSGKSTLVKILCGIIRADGGEVRCLGYQPFKQRNEYVRHIGATFGQKSLLYSDLPLKDSLELYRVVYDMTRDEYQQSMKRLDGYFGINDILAQPVRKMSFGQRIRGEIVASVMHNPQLLFLDEPNIGLDIVARGNLAEYIQSRSREGKTTLLITHDAELLAAVCSRLIVLDGGVKIFDDTAEMLHRQAITEIEVEFTGIRDPEAFERAIQGVKCKERKISSLVLSPPTAEVDELISRISQACSLARLVVRPPDARDVIYSLLAGRQESQ